MNLVPWMSQYTHDNSWPWLWLMVWWWIFYVSTWRDGGTQTFGQTLVQVVLWSYYLDGINIRNGGLWEKIIPDLGLATSNQLKALRGKDRGPSRKRELCLQMAFSVELQYQGLLGLQPDGLPCIFQTCQTCVSDSLDFCLLSSCLPLYTHTPLVILFLWRTLLQMVQEGGEGES